MLPANEDTWYQYNCFNMHFTIRVTGDDDPLKTGVMFVLFPLNLIGLLFLNQLFFYIEI
ncbi:MAG: hypothetical protein ABSE83_05100 [Methanobacterium sp.]